MIYVLRWAGTDNIGKCLACRDIDEVIAKAKELVSLGCSVAITVQEVK